MKFIDLFCGIGGFRIALEKAGATCVFSSDIDPFARKTYQHNFGEEPAGDITQIDAKDIPSHDILCAGFPCQSFSVAGKRKGFQDTRGTLFFEIVRIAQYHNPKALLLENVKGLLSHDKGNTFKIIKESLEEIGYRVLHNVYNTLHFGLPQKRERVFIIALKIDVPDHLDFGDYQYKRLSIFALSNIPSPAPSYIDISTIIEPSVKPHYYYKPTGAIYAKLLPIFEKNPKAIVLWRRGNMRIYNDYTPTLVASMGTGGHNVPIIQDTVGIRKMTPQERLKLQGFGTLSLSSILDKQVDDKYTLTNKAWDSIQKRKVALDSKGHGFGYCLYKPDAMYVGTFVSHYAKRGDEILIEQEGKNPRVLTPQEALRLQGFSNLFVLPVSETQAYKQIGNAVPVPVAYYIAKHLVEFLRTQ